MQGKIVGFLVFIASFLTFTRFENSIYGVNYLHIFTPKKDHSLNATAVLADLIMPINNIDLNNIGLLFAAYKVRHNSFTNSNLSISEIAYQTGFESTLYLSKIFKKKNKVSPKLYREVLQ